MTIRGVVFDFGGVIVNMRWDMARKLEEEYGLERTTLVRTYYDSDDWRAIETGSGDIEQWREAAHQRLEAVAGRALPLLHQQWRESWGPIDENLALIRALRPPYRIAVLSNADITLEERMRSTKLDRLFDDIVCSAAVGLAKPDARIYALAARRLALSVEECLFIDDMERNVLAAREAGMAAIHFRVHEGDNLAEQLAEHGVAPGATL
ncbi:MAG: HAD family phosphatase [Dehalococcoidia bacterium]